MTLLMTALVRKTPTTDDRATARRTTCAREMTYFVTISRAMKRRSVFAARKHSELEHTSSYLKISDLMLRPLFHIRRASSMHHL